MQNSVRTPLIGISGCEMLNVAVASALIPTHVAVPIDISESFPCDDETVKLSEHLVTDTMKLSPNINFAGAGASLGEVSRQGDKKLYGFLHLNRIDIPGEHDIQIHWFVHYCRYRLVTRK